MKKLSKGSLDKYESVINRLYRADLTAKEALSLSDNDLKKALNFKGVQASFEGLKRNINNVEQSQTKDNQRAKVLIDYTVNKSNVKAFQKARRQIAIKVIGKNTFWFGVDKAKELGYGKPIKATDTSVRRAKQFGYNRLNKRQKQIIDAISP